VELLVGSRWDYAVRPGFSVIIEDVGPHNVALTCYQSGGEPWPAELLRQLTTADFLGLVESGRLVPHTTLLV
jgi:hypothetical protein